jgi:hypothetical protein
MDLFDFHGRSPGFKRYFLAKRRYWLDRFVHVTHSIVLKPENPVIEDHNPIIEVYEVTNPEETRYQRHAPENREPEYLDDGAEDSRPYRKDCNECDEDGLHIEKGVRPSRQEQDLECKENKTGRNLIFPDARLEDKIERDTHEHKRAQPDQRENVQREGKGCFEKFRIHVPGNGTGQSLIGYEGTYQQTDTDRKYQGEAFRYQGFH